MRRAGVGSLLKLLAPVGALALGLLLVVGVAGMMVRLPWEPPCVVRATPGEPLAHGTVAEMRQYADRALAPAGGSGTPSDSGQGASVDSAGPGQQNDGVDPSDADLRAALRSGPSLTCTIESIAASAVPKDLAVGLTPPDSAVNRDLDHVHIDVA